MNDIEVKVMQTAGVIECNFGEIEAALRNQMQAYEELEVTEENIPERKADVATLRKIKTAVDDKRKEVKRTYDQPLKEFEAKVKSITGILDEQIVRINGELNAFEQKRIEAKQAHIQELYDENIGELAEFLPLSVIKDPKWDNKTCSDNEIIFSIQEKTMKVKTDLTAIKALGSDIEDKLIKAYKDSGNNLATAITKNTEYQEAKKAAEERLKAEAEAKAKEEARLQEEAARQAFELARKHEVITLTPNDRVVEIPFDAMNEPVMVIRVVGMENIDALKDFLELSGIEYEEV